MEGERKRELRKEAKTYRERCASGVVVVPSKSPRSRPVRDTSFSSLADRSWLCDQSNPSCSPFPSSFCQSCGHRPRYDRILTPCSFQINLAVYREVNLHRISFFFFFSSTLFFTAFFFIFYFILSLSLFLPPLSLLFFFLITKSSGVEHWRAIEYNSRNCGSVFVSWTRTTIVATACYKNRDRYEFSIVFAEDWIKFPCYHEVNFYQTCVRDESWI